jgi:hypothetical protein
MKAGLTVFALTIFLDFVEEVAVVEVDGEVPEEEGTLISSLEDIDEDDFFIKLLQSRLHPQATHECS